MKKLKFLILIILIGLIIYLYFSLNKDHKVEVPIGENENNLIIKDNTQKNDSNIKIEEINEDFQESFGDNQLEEMVLEDNIMTETIYELQEINEDVFGILEVPNTNISYPVVYSDDNEFYLRRDLKGNYSLPGTVFLDYENNLDIDNLIFYGHNMGNGTMFSDLMNFKDADYFNSHNKINLYLEQEIFHYQVYGAYLIDLTYINPGI